MMWELSDAEFKVTGRVIISGLLEAELCVRSRFKTVLGRTVVTAVPKSLQTVSFMLLPGTAADPQLQAAKKRVRKENNPVHS